MGGVQLHDFNPGITQNGLFWTVVLPADTVDVDLDAGTATLDVHDLHVTDDYTFENSVLHNIGRPSTPAVVSFQVVWNATGGVNVVDNAAQQFRGEFINASAHMEYSGRAGDFEFESAPLGDSTTDAAELGRESKAHSASSPQISDLLLRQGLHCALLQASVRMMSLTEGDARYCGYDKDEEKFRHSGPPKRCLYSLALFQVQHHRATPKGTTPSDTAKRARIRDLSEWEG